MTPNMSSEENFRQRDTRAIESNMPDRFELLSAYLDGELTVADRKQVQEWLTTDTEVQRQYAKLLKLRQGMQMLPVPPAAQPTQQLISAVFARLDRYRFKRAVVLAGSAIAAVFVGGLLTVGERSPMLQMAESPQPKAQPEAVMVALNGPVIPIPKAAVADPEKSVKPVSETSHTSKNID